MQRKLTCPNFNKLFIFFFLNSIFVAASIKNSVHLQGYTDCVVLGPTTVSYYHNHTATKDTGEPSVILCEIIVRSLCLVIVMHELYLRFHLNLNLDSLLLTIYEACIN